MRAASIDNSMMCGTKFEIQEAAMPAMPVGGALIRVGNNHMICIFTYRMVAVSCIWLDIKNIYNSNLCIKCRVIAIILCYLSYAEIGFLTITH